MSNRAARNKRRQAEEAVARREALQVMIAQQAELAQAAARGPVRLKSLLPRPIRVREGGGFKLLPVYVPRVLTEIEH